MDALDLQMIKNPEYIEPIYSCYECGEVIVPKGKIYKGIDKKLILAFKKSLVCDECKISHVKEKRNSPLKKRKYCRKCGVYLEPKQNKNIPNNILLSRYQKSEYVCNECMKKIRSVKK